MSVNEGKVNDVMAVLRRSTKISVSRSGVENAISAVPKADPLSAAHDLVAWAEGATNTVSAGPLLLKFMRGQADNGASGKRSEGRDCAECGRWKPYDMLLQGRCKLGCYDAWASRHLDYHDRFLAAQVASLNGRRRA